MDTGFEVLDAFDHVGRRGSFGVAIGRTGFDGVGEEKFPAAGIAFFADVGLAVDDFWGGFVRIRVEVEVMKVVLLEVEGVRYVAYASGGRRRLDRTQPRTLDRRRWYFLCLDRGVSWLLP